MIVRTVSNVAYTNQPIGSLVSYKHTIYINIAYYFIVTKCILYILAEDIIPPAGKKDTIIDIIPKTNDMSDGEEDMESDEEED